MSTDIYLARRGEGNVFTRVCLLRRSGGGLATGGSAFRQNPYGYSQLALGTQPTGMQTCFAICFNHSN